MLYLIAFLSADDGVEVMRQPSMREKPPSKIDNHHLAAIIGGSVGGIALIMLIITIVIVKHR